MGVPAKTNFINLDTGLSAVWRAAFYHIKIHEREVHIMKEFWNMIQVIFAAAGGVVGLVSGRL